MKAFRNVLLTVALALPMLAQTATFSTPDPNDTAAVKAAVVAGTQMYVDHMNESRKTVYLVGFDNWKINVDAGRIDNLNPPKPPMAWLVKTDADGWAYPALSDKPVCDMPPVPEDHSKTAAEIKAALPPMVIDIGPSADGNAGVWFAVGPNDTWPVGKKTPPMPDGHVYLRVGSIAGAGWYERL